MINSKKKASFNRCSECGKLLIYDNKRGDTICSECGLVNSEKRLLYKRIRAYSKFEKDLKKRTGRDKQLKDEKMRNTYFNPKELRFSKLRDKFRRLKRQEYRLMDKTYEKVLRILYRFETAFSIPYYIIVSIFKRYKKLQEDGFAKNQKIKEFLIALIYYECRKNQLVIKLSDLCKYIEANYNVSFKLYQRILRKLDLKPPQIKILTYLDYCCNKINCHNLKLDLLRNLKRIKPNFQGKDPITILGGLIYVISKKRDICLTQKKIAKSLKLSLRGIQRYIYQFEKIQVNFRN